MIIKPTTIIVILSIIVSRDWTLQKLDVRNTFLHRILEEEVCVKQSYGYDDLKSPKYIYKLYNALYSLKQGANSFVLMIE
jgi:hypothetical protein